MKVLLVVDMINDFVDKKGTLCVKGAEELIPKINRVIREFANRNPKNNVILYICDAHSENDPEFASWAVHAVSGTWSSALHPDLLQADCSILFTKQKISSFSNPIFEKFLAELKAEELLVTGVATDYCIKAVTLDGLERGYKVVVLDDCIAGVNLKEGDVQKAIGEMIVKGAEFAESGEVLGGRY
jgi:nicotinamidase-related amidase